jgi:rhomboid family protein
MSAGRSMFSGGFGARRSIVTTLIVVNAVIFFLCTTGPLGNSLFSFGAMRTDLVMGGQFWRLITSDYLHWNFWHLFVNMLGLYFLGRPLEQLWGAKRFFVTYTVAGLLGSLFFMSLNLLGWLPMGTAVGASGCVLGLLGAAAVLFPHAEVYIYFLFPVKIRVVAAVMGIWYLWNILMTGQNAGGDACHLAGLAYGVWWAMKGESWWNGLRRHARTKPFEPAGFKQRIRQRQSDAELIDRILSKVHERGIGSLTRSEKESLAAATQRQQRDEAQFGRVDRL